MILPKDSFDSLIGRINEGSAGITAIKESFNKIDSAKATATRAVDDEKIKAAIRETVGFEKLNSCVKKTMIEWVGHVVTEQMRMLVLDEGNQHVDQIETGAVNSGMEDHTVREAEMEINTG